MKKKFIYITLALLLVVDWLTFHNIFESHTIRDWLTLLTSLLVFYYFSKELPKK